MRPLNTLQTRFILIILATLLIPAGIIAVYQGTTSADTLTTLLSENTQQLVTARATELESFLLNSRSDILFLSQSSQLRRFINESLPERQIEILPEIGSLLENFIGRYAGKYTGGCLIALNGDEQVCVRMTDNDIRILNAQEHENRIDTAYFNEPLRLSGIPGAYVPVFMSDIIPSRDGSRQAMYVSTPLIEDAGVVDGILTLEIDASTIEQIIICHSGCRDFKLVDENGSALLSSLSASNTLQQAFPAYADDMLRQPSGAYLDSENDILLTFARIRPPGQGAIQWTLIYQQPASIITQSIYRDWLVMTLVTGITLLIALVLAILLVRNITRPLYKLADAASQIKTGNYHSVDLRGINRQDEIGTLARAFQQMLMHISQLVDDLRGQVTALEAARTQAQQNAERYRHFFEESPISLWEQDFSGIKTALDDLNRQGDDLRDYLTQHPEIVTRCMSTLRVMAANRASLRIYGAPTMSYLLNNLALFMPKIYGESHLEMLLAVAAGDQQFRIETTNYTWDGDPLHVIINGSVMPGHEEDYRRVLLSIEDITERKQAETRLMESEQRYRMVTDLMSDYAFYMRLEDDGQQHIAWITDSFERITGYHPDRLNTQSPRTDIHPDDRVRTDQDIQRTFSGEITSGIYRIYHRDGHIMWLEIARHPVFDPDNPERVTGYYGVAKDVTERVRQEEALRASEALNTTIVAAIPDYIFRINRDGIFMDVYAGNLDGLFVNAEKLRGQPLPAILPEHIAQTTLDGIQKTLATGEMQVIEYSLYDQHSNLLYEESRIVPFSNEDEVLVVVRDITERKQAEQALRESEARFRTMADSAPMFIWLSDETGACVYLNQSWLTYTGRTVEQEYGAGWKEGLHPDDYENYLRLYEDALKSRTPFSTEYRLQDHEGEYHWILDTAVPRFSEAGDFLGFIGSCVQIDNIKEAEAILQETNETLEKRVRARTSELMTINHQLQHEIVQRQEAEIALVASNERLQIILDMLPAAVLATDLENGSNLYRNAAAERMFEFPLDDDELQLASFYYTDPQDRERFIQILNQTGFIREEEVELQTHNGQSLRVIFSAQRLEFEGRDAVMAAMMDITHRYRMEEALRQREASLRMLTDNASDLICLHDLDGTYEYVSPSCYRVLGYTPDEMLGTDPYGYFHPDDRERIRSGSHDLIINDLEETTITYRIQQKCGEYIWLETHNSVVVDDENQPTHLITVSHDVTDRIQMENQLRESRRFLQSILDSLTSHIAILDDTGTILAVNDAWREFGRRNQANPATIEGVGINYLSVTASDTTSDAETVLTGIEQVLNGTIQSFYHEYMLPVGSPETDMWFAMRVNRFLYDESVRAVVAHTDITQRRRVEEDIRKALEKEQELNQLKSQFFYMVTHDFKNPLAAIKTTTQLLQRYENRLNTAERNQRMGRILIKVEQMNKLLEDILYIGQNQTGTLNFEPEPTDLTVFCQDIAADIELTFQTSNRIRLTISGIREQVAVDQMLLHKILTNLLSNAIKYSDDDSVVYFKVNCDETHLTFHIKDEGIGIPAEEQDGLFQVFRRGRNVGSIPGTGLGLMIVQQATKQHGGTVSFTSVENEGTTFIVTIPVSPDALPDHVDGDES